MAVPSLFVDPLFTQVILPFILIFVIVYAVLQKAKIFGINKQIDIIVALVIAFIFIGVPTAVGITLNIIPIIAVILVILLSALLLFGFVGIEIQANKGIKIGAGIALGIAMIGIIIWATGIKFPSLSEEVINYIIIFALIIGAGAAILSSSKKEK
jgi:hypothetical protein